MCPCSMWFYVVVVVVFVSQCCCSVSVCARSPPPSPPLRVADSVPMKQLSFELEENDEEEDDDDEDNGDAQDGAATTTTTTKKQKKKQRILDRAIEDAFCRNDAQSFRVGQHSSSLFCFLSFPFLSLSLRLTTQHNTTTSPSLACPLSRL